MHDGGGDGGGGRQKVTVESSLKTLLNAIRGGIWGANEMEAGMQIMAEGEKGVQRMGRKAQIATPPCGTLWFAQ